MVITVGVEAEVESDVDVVTGTGVASAVEFGGFRTNREVY
jgi:hypothetical protein